ncbi:MAG: DUF1841 family protein [Aquisalimonadaceae bacterium]
MFSSDRDALRLQYVDAWRKYRAGQVLTPLEDMIARVVTDHPEYQPLLESEERALGGEYLPEDGATNPFLHMGMHLALREQISTDRPAGIRAIHQDLSRSLNSPLEAEHRMMDHLAEALWRAQRDGVMPDENAYLAALKNLANEL